MASLNFNILCIRLFQKNKPLLFLSFFLINHSYFSQIKNDSTKTSVKNIGANINSDFDDYAPVISSDGNTMYFTSRRPVTDKELKKNTPSKEHIFVSYFDTINKTWSQAVLVESLKNPMSSKRNSSAIALLHDGKKMLLFQDDLYGNGDIYESQFIDNKWSYQLNLGDSINSEAHESSASFSPDGNTLYFVSNRAGGAGGRDIWYSTKSANGTWSSPKNIGKNINTTKDEECVFAHPDGKTLFFSSKAHKSKGGYDVFKSEWNAKTNSWSLPTNLGAPINTKGDDIFYVQSANNQKAFYTSVDPKQKNSDRNIFEVLLSPVKKTKPVQPVKYKIICKGLVTDQNNNILRSALVELYDQDAQKQIFQSHTNESDGAYQFQLDSINHLSIHVSSKGYTFYTENVYISNASLNKDTVIVRNIKLKKISIGESFVMKNIYFDSDRSSLKHESKNELDKLIQFLNDNPEVSIEISGHTDNKGSHEHNQKLSEDRALEVKNYLMALGGIYSERIEYKGYAATKPIADNSSEDGREKNRRTEFKILKIN